MSERLLQDGLIEGSTNSSMIDYIISQYNNLEISITKTEESPLFPSNIELESDAHKTATKYLNSIEQRFSEEQLEEMYKITRKLIKNILCKRYSEGINGSFMIYESIKHKDHDAFILITFLEAFYIEFPMFRWPGKEYYEIYFKEALDLAIKADSNNIVKRVYQQYSFLDR